MIIGKSFKFEAAHQLPDKEIYGKCSRLHGHSYKLVVEIRGKVGNDGWVINFKELKAIVNAKIIDKLDHSFLNDIVELPTAENILAYISKELVEAMGESARDYLLFSIKLYETENSFAKVYFDDKEAM